MYHLQKCHVALALRQILLVTAALLSTNAQCSPGAVPASCSAVLVICPLGGGPSYCEAVRDTILGTGAFATVDNFYDQSSTPTASELAQYHAVLVADWGGGPGFHDASLLGDRLADFHDQGGGVVITTNYGGIGLLGTYASPANGYALLNYAQGSLTSTEASLGTVVESQSPLMTGVASLSASSAHRSSAPIINGAVVVAKWSSGEPLVLRGTRGNRALVELNFFAPSNWAQFGSWTGDGAELLRNALQYSRCMFCGAGTFAIAGATSCADCSPGSYSSSPGASSCAACGPGSYSSSPAATTCLQCPAAYSLGSTATLPVSLPRSPVCATPIPDWQVEYTL